MDLVVRWTSLWALAIGALGSFAYVAAVFYGFVGEATSRDLLLKHFSPTVMFRVGAYGVIGGFIAVVFQLPEDSFVPVQSFLLGATWPTIIGQHITGRQSGLSGEEVSQNLVTSPQNLDLTGRSAETTRDIDSASRLADEALGAAVADLSTSVDTDSNPPSGEGGTSQ